jgi:hypothetical protein
MPVYALLNNPVAAIHAINAMDSHALGLINDDQIADYIKKLAGAAKNKLLTDSEAVADFNREWLEDHKKNDPRAGVKVDTNLSKHQWGTVMTLATFERTYEGTVRQLRDIAASRQDLSTNTHNLPTVELFQKISVLEDEVLPALVASSRRGCMWIAPSAADVVKLGADKCRDKLGLTLKT